MRLAGEGISLSELAGQLTGEIANFSEVSSGLDRIKKQLRRQGFLDPTAVDRTLDDGREAGGVLVVHVDHGPRYVFGALTVEGLNLNGGR